MEAQEPVLQDTFHIEIHQGSLNNALQQVSDVTGVRFAYRTSILDHKTTLAKNYHAPLNEILNKLITDNRLCFSWQAGQVIVHTSCIPQYYTVQGSVLADSTYLPIPFVSISIINKGIGIIGDEQGRFEMDVPIADTLPDTLVFSCMGFIRDTILVLPHQPGNLTCILRQKTYAVPEATIRPKSYTTDKLGNTKGRAAGALYLDTHGQQVALFVENKSKADNYIESVACYLSGKGNAGAPFRIRLYSADSTGRPGNDFMEDAVIVKPPGKEGWYTVDISMLGIRLPSNGLFVAIEGVFPKDGYSFFENSDGFTNLAKPEKMPSRHALMYGQKIGYNRKCKEQTWHYSAEKVWFQLEKQAFGIMISATVKYETDKNLNDE